MTGADSSHRDPRRAAAAARRTIVAWRRRAEAATASRSTVAEPAAEYDAAARGAAWIVDLGAAVAPADGWTIRVATPARRVACAGCGGRFAAAGPTGHRDGEPVCDPCLLDGCAELGMVLALVAVSRAYGRLDPSGDGELAATLEELGAFARVYERFAARSGPPRPFARPRR